MPVPVTLDDFRRFRRLAGRKAGIPAFLFAATVFTAFFVEAGSPAAVESTAGICLLYATGDALGSATLSLEAGNVRLTAHRVLCPLDEKQKSVTAVHSVRGGETAVLEREERGVSILDLAGGAALEIPDAVRPVVSPDGKYCAYFMLDAYRQESPPSDDFDVMVVRPAAPERPVLRERSFGEWECLFHAGRFYCSGDAPSTLSVYAWNLATLQKERVAEGWHILGASPGGERMVLAQAVAEGSFNEDLRLLGTESGKVFYEMGGGNLCSPALSPDGRWMAIQFHLSRPLTGHLVIDLEKKAEGPVGYELKGYAPVLIGKWSDDSRWMLCNYRVPDPENNGNWLREDAHVVSVEGDRFIRVGKGIKPDRCAFTGRSGLLLFLDGKDRLHCLRFDAGKAAVTDLGLRAKAFAILDE